MVAAEKRGGADGHVGDDEAEKHTLANMTPDVYAAVEMHHCHVHDERTDRVIAKEAEYDLTRLERTPHYLQGFARPQ